VITRATSSTVAIDWTLQEFAHAFRQPAPSHNSAEIERTRNSGGGSWYGGISTVADAERLLDRGWSDGAARLESMARDVTPPTARCRKRKPVWRDQGDELDVDRALVGDWGTAWRASHRMWSPGPSTVDLYAAIGGNAHRSADELFWAGATAAILTDLLEGAGYTVRVIGSIVAINRNDSQRAMVTRVVVKETSEPLRLDALAAVACHAGVFRTLGFRALLESPVYTDLGNTTAVPWSRLESQLRDGGEWPEGLIIDAAYDRESCLAEIKRVLTLIGGE
jgi:hypothetical protein